MGDGTFTPIFAAINQVCQPSRGKKLAVHTLAAILADREESKFAK